MTKTAVRHVVIAAVGAILVAAGWPGRGLAQPAAPDRVKQLEHEIDLLKMQVKTLNFALDQMMDLVDKLNKDVANPDVQQKLAQLRAARTPAAIGKARRLTDLTDVERAEIMKLEGQIKISTNPIEDMGRLVSRLWDLGVYDATAREMEKLFKAEDKAKGDRWHQVLAERIGRDFGKFDKPDNAEMLLKVLLDYPLNQENEKGLAWLNGCAGASRQLFAADPNLYKGYLAKAIKLYELSLKLNPTQPDVRDALRALHKAKADSEKT